MTDRRVNRRRFVATSATVAGLATGATVASATADEQGVEGDERDDENANASLTAGAASRA